MTYPAYRPCGLCRELVPAESGCTHWRPLVSAARKGNGSANEAARRKRAAQKRREQRAALKAKEAVAEFRRQMGYEA